MTSQRRSTKLQLRRSISEQLRDSTSKAWDLLWRNVRERRLAGQRAKWKWDEAGGLVFNLLDTVQAYYGTNVSRHTDRQLSSNLCVNSILFKNKVQSAGIKISLVLPTAGGHSLISSHCSIIKRLWWII